MPSKLIFWNVDPNKEMGYNRGRGIYYHRGNGFWSKYSVPRDRKKLSTGWEDYPDTEQTLKQSMVGLPTEGNRRHILDGFIDKRLGYKTQRVKNINDIKPTDKYKKPPYKRRVKGTWL